MTILEYAERLGINLSAAQKEILTMWEESESKNEFLIISTPRCNGRQMLYDLIQRYKGYRQGRAETIDEFVDSLINPNNYNRYDFDECLSDSNKANDFYNYVFAMAEQMKERSSESNRD